MKDEAADEALEGPALGGLDAYARREKAVSLCDARESERTGKGVRLSRLTDGGDIGCGRISWPPTCCIADVVSELMALFCATSDPIEELDVDIEAGWEEGHDAEMFAHSPTKPIGF